MVEIFDRNFSNKNNSLKYKYASIIFNLLIFFIQNLILFEKFYTKIFKKITLLNIMENVILNQNVYKFSKQVINMTKINGKEVSSLSLKELKKYIEELEDWLEIQKGLESMRTEKHYTPKEAREFLKKCLKN